MSDNVLRDLERTYAESRCRDDWLLWLIARARAGLPRLGLELLTYRRGRVHVVGSRHQVTGGVLPACGRERAALTEDPAVVEWSALERGFSFPNRKRGQRGPGPCPRGWCPACVGATRKRRARFGGKLLQASQANVLRHAFEPPGRSPAPERWPRYHRWRRLSSRGGRAHGERDDVGVCKDCGVTRRWHGRLGSAMGRDLCWIRFLRLGAERERHYYDTGRHRTLCGEPMDVNTGDHAFVNLLLSGLVHARPGDCRTCREEHPKVLR